VITTAYCDGVPGPDRSAPGRPRFPALDLEPPPRPWWWRVLVSAGVLAAAGALAAAVAFWPFASGPARSGTAAARSGLLAALDRGRIVALDSAGYLVLADPGGAGGSRPLAVRGPGLPVAWLPLAGGR
jgi:hypothetical protein